MPFSSNAASEPSTPGSHAVDGTPSLPHFLSPRPASALGGMNSVATVEVRLVTVTELPALPPVPGVAPSLRPEDVTARPVVRVEMRIRKETIEGKEEAIEEDAAASQAMAESRTSSPSLGTSLRSTSTVGGGRQITPPFRANSSTAAAADPSDELARGDHTLTFFGPGLPVIDKNAPPAERTSSGYYYYLDVVVQPSALSSLGLSTSESMSRSAKAASLTQRRATFATKKAPPPFGKATLFLNPLEAEVVHREALRFAEPTNAFGRVELEVRLSGCGVLRALDPPRPLRDAVLSLAQAELGDVYTAEFVRHAADAMMHVLTERQGLSPETEMADVDPHSETARRHAERHRILRRELDRYRPVGVALDPAIAHARTPPFAACPGVAFTFDDLFAFLVEVHLRTGTVIPPEQILREDLQRAVAAFAREQASERAVVERLRDPEAADAAITAYLERRDARRRAKEVPTEAVALFAVSSGAQAEDEEAAAAEDAVDSDDEYVLLARAQALKAKMRQETEEALLEVAPKQNMHQLLTSWDRAIGRNRARLAITTLRELFASQLRMWSQASVVELTDERQRAPSMDPTALTTSPNDKYAVTAPRYAAAFALLVAARAAEQQRLLALRELAQREILVSLNEAVQLFTSAKAKPLFVQTMARQKWVIEDALRAVPIVEGAGATWRCPLLTAADEARGDLVKLRQASHMTLPPPTSDGAGVISSCIPRARTFAGYRRADGQILLSTLRPIVGSDVPPLAVWQPSSILDYNLVVAKEERRKKRVAKALKRENPDLTDEEIEHMIRPIDYEVPGDELELMTTRPTEACCDELSNVVLRRLRLVECKLNNCYIEECVIVGGEVRGGWLESCQIERGAKLTHVQKLRSSHLTGHCTLTGFLPVNCIMLDCELHECEDSSLRTTNDRVAKGVALCTLARCKLLRCALVQCDVREADASDCRDEGFNAIRGSPGLMNGLV